ncbi:MAG: hypothetical protein ACFHU9_03670 [Fluviicola sp.]
MTNTTKSHIENDKPNVFSSEEHLIRFGYLDGFCERLLEVELLVDLELNFELSYSTFQLKRITKLGRFDDNIGTELLALIELDLSLLKKDYDIHDGATDFPFYTLVVNQYGDNWKFTLGAIPVKSEEHSVEEQLFFKTLLTLKNFLMKETGYEIN